MGETPRAKPPNRRNRESQLKELCAFIRALERAENKRETK